VTIDFDKYETAVRCLATMMMVVIEEGRLPYFEHFGENNLHAVPDMLTRLGVMEEFKGAHRFCFDWNPAMQLQLMRHKGEPSLDDLGIGLDFCLSWYGPMNLPNEFRTRAWAINGLANAAEALGRGLVIDGTYVSEDARGEYVIEDYWVSRKQVSDNLGGEHNLYPEGKMK
jgi:hypothetical protein